MSNILNKPCVCGSKLKYKFCCKTKFINFNQNIIQNLADDINNSAEDALGVLKNHYSKFVVSFYVELADKGIKQLNPLVEKYDGLWRDYCSFVSLDIPEKERYFIVNLAKNIGAELEQRSEKESSYFTHKKHFLET